MSALRNSALVLFSGGQDSTTCLAWALKNYDYVETIGFDYGQRHIVELQVRAHLREQLREISDRWQGHLGEDHLIQLGWVREHLATALTRTIEIRTEVGAHPNTFVPGRNLLFLTVAGALAQSRGLNILVGGMCEADNSGYPDCRDDTLKALQVALNLGMDTRLRLETPLMWLDKSEIWQLSEQLGGAFLVDLIIEKTHTCYLGTRDMRHPWGYGCGNCPACFLRAEGFHKYSKLRT